MSKNMSTGSGTGTPASLELQSIPKVSKCWRFTNVLINFLEIISISLILLMAVMILMMSTGRALPIILSLTAITAFLISFISIAGSGLKASKILYISAIIEIFVALILFNILVYFLVIGFKVLGVYKSISLLNPYHYTLMTTILLAFLSAYISIIIAEQVLKSNEWMGENRPIWGTPPVVTEGGKSVEPVVTK